MLSQLLKPLAYLTIVHKDKRKVDWLYPVFLALATTIALRNLTSVEYMWNTGGLVSMALGFIQSLPGFYIAALAAVATFGKRGIDQYLADHPYIYKKMEDERIKIHLTRRVFLCMLFAFLTYESIILILFSIAGMIIKSQKISLIFSEIDLLPFISAPFEFLYFLMFFQMLIATFWGLFYLGYKIHE
jgi:hypothetical protein